MPLNKNNQDDIRSRVFYMLEDTIKSFRLISEFSGSLFSNSEEIIRNAINECLHDFYNPKNKENHPQSIIFTIDFENFERVGFYGAQLNLKEKQVFQANQRLRKAFPKFNSSIFRKSFIWWVDVINNFLGSFISGFGIAERLKELKDCIRDEVSYQDL